MPGGPLSVPPAAIAAAWNASTVLRSGLRKATCTGRARLAALGEEEVRLALGAVTRALDEVQRQLVAERPERLCVERLQGFDVPDVQCHVIEHG